MTRDEAIAILDKLDAGDIADALRKKQAQHVSQARKGVVKPARTQVKARKGAVKPAQASATKPAPVVLKAPELAPMVTGKTLKAIWESKQVKAVAAEIREQFQSQVNAWALAEHRTHPPVYVSLKPKITKTACYIAREHGKGALVVYPVRIAAYGDKRVTCLSVRDMFAALNLEYTKHMAR